MSREGVNARHLEAPSFDEPIKLIVVDASFIGCDRLLPALASVLVRSGPMLALMIPQFGIGRTQTLGGAALDLLHDGDSEPLVFEAQWQHQV